MSVVEESITGKSALLQLGQDLNREKNSFTLFPSRCKRFFHHGVDKGIQILIYVYPLKVLFTRL